MMLKDRVLLITNVEKFAGHGTTRVREGKQQAADQHRLRVVADGGQHVALWERVDQDIRRHPNFADILTLLDLKDPAKSAKVHDLVVAQYRAFTCRDLSIRWERRGVGPGDVDLL